MDNKKHHFPHIHVRYTDSEAVFKIPEGDLIEGNLPRRQVRMVQAWIEIHQEELMADWHLAISGNEVYKIAPLI